MTDPNGWPDPDKPGVPMNPERDGWHWLARDSTPEPWRWSAKRRCFEHPAGMAAPIVPQDCWHYLGPCLTPQEVAAREQAAREGGQRTGLLGRLEAEALDAMLAKARREGMEAAAMIADQAALKADRSALEEWGYSDSGKVRERIYARKHEATEIAAAIRAAAKETKP